MKPPLWKKITVCLLAGSLGMFSIRVDISHYLSLGIRDSAISIAAIAFLTVSVLYIPLWHYRENKQISNANTLGFWQGVIIYMESFVFFRFGFLKLFGLHMSSSLIFSDMPAGALSGYHLMDYFFARAPEFKIIIGSLQIIGATFLLFKKTRLLGVFILLPIIVNIVCMDIFYDIGGVTITAILLLAGLVYFLFQDKTKLLSFFLDSNTEIAPFEFKNKLSKNAVRISTLIIPLLILIPAIKPIQNNSILGKYRVSSLILNDKEVSIDLNEDSVLTTIYFDENETCVFRFNDYKKIKIGKAIYNESSNDLEVKWRYPLNQRDTSCLKLSAKNSKGARILSGKLANENFKATLVKVDLPNVVIN